MIYIQQVGMVFDSNYVTTHNMDITNEAKTAYTNENLLPLLAGIGRQEYIIDGIHTTLYHVPYDDIKAKYGDDVSIMKALTYHAELNALFMTLVGGRQYDEEDFDLATDAYQLASMYLVTATRLRELVNMNRFTTVVRETTEKLADTAEKVSGEFQELDEQDPANVYSMPVLN